MASVKLEDLTVTYNRIPAIHHITGEFKAGSLTAIAGPNGAGKSTLLKAIAGILKANDGEIIIENASRSEIAYLPQSSEIERNFPLSVAEFISTGLWQQSGGFGKIDNNIKAKLAESIKIVGLENFAEHSIEGLSIGQFQRVLFARLLLQEAKIILLDEPFNAVDNPTITKLIELIKLWHSQKRTIICVLHDYAQIKTYFPECLLLAGKCVAWGSVNEVLAENIAL